MAFKTFDELATYAALDIHNALLVGGGKSMKGAVHLWLGQAIIWDREQNKPPQKPSRKRKN